MWRPCKPTLVLLPLVAVALVALASPGPVLAHAAEVHLETVRAVAVVARYDTGAPMAGAQITVYSPANPAEPWLRAQADAEGRLVFVPDAHVGRWSVQARHAGHGAVAHLMREEEDGTLAAGWQTAPASGPDPLQKGLMAASVIWGCIGTALYFRRRNT